MVGFDRDEPSGDEADEALLIAARVDHAAFAAFYDKRYKRVVAFFYRRTLCPYTASELAAETFVCAWARRKRFDPTQGSAMGWLMGIAGNLYRNWLRRGVVSDRARRRWGLDTPRLVQDDLEEIEALVDLVPLLAGLRQALEELSPKLREAVIMRVADDLSYEEVAYRLNCSVGAARVRVSRGLDFLLTRLESQP